MPTFDFDKFQTADDSTTAAPQATPSAVAPTAQPSQNQPSQFNFSLYSSVPETEQEKYSTFKQQAITGLEAVAKGAFGPLATAAEVAAGIAPEEMEARERSNPNLYMGLETAGLVGPALLSFGSTALGRLGLSAAAEAAPAIAAASKFTQGAALESMANAAMKTLGVSSEGAGAVGRIGSAMVKGAIENAAFQSGDEISKQILHPEFSKDAAASALVDITGAGLLGSVVGGTFGAAPELWKATLGSKTSGVLHALGRKLGGVEGVVSEPVSDAISRLGVDVPPEVVASMADDLEIKQLASVLNQSDTTNAGLEFQKASKDFQNALDRKMIQVLGKDPETLTHEFSEYASGNKIGNTLATEYATKIDPISAKFEAAKTKYGPAELGRTMAEKELEAAKIQSDLDEHINKLGKKLNKALKSNDTASAVDIGAQLEQAQQSLKELNSAAKMPGIKDIIAEQVAHLVEDNGWRGTDDIMKEVNRLFKRLPEIKTVSELSKEITTIGNNTASTLPFGQQTPLSRAGSLLKNVLREAEGAGVAHAMGAVEGLEAMNAFNSNRKSFAEIAKLKDALDDRLKAGGSVTNYAKGLRSMAQTDGEAILRRLSGRGDANLLELLQNQFPETAQAVREAFIDKLAADAVKRAKGEQLISRATLINKIDELGSKSPELRDFALSENTRAKIADINLLADKFADATHNYSNTGRTVQKLLSGHFNSALGLMTGLMSHNPVAGVIVGYLSKALGKDAPDAIRLSLLKFLGSNKPIDSAGFKAMVEFAHTVIKGESLLTKSVQNVFKAGAQVLPEHYFTTEKEREKMRKDLEKLSANPTAILQQNIKTAHYMPEVAQNLSATSARIGQYLESIKPKPHKPGPLDQEIEPSKAQQAAYDRALDIANQPLTILQHIKNGTLLPTDALHLKVMYPEVYDKLNKQLSHELAEALTNKVTIPFKTRQSLSLFLASPLDLSFTPQAIQSIQSTFMPTAPQQGQQGQATKKKKSTAPLSKLPQQLETQDQARAARGKKQ
jgi:hypothetical protein